MIGLVDGGDKLFEDLKNVLDKVEVALEKMAQRENCDICRNSKTMFSLAGIGRKIWFCTNCRDKCDKVYRQLIENSIFINIEEHRENTLMESRIVDEM